VIVNLYFRKTELSYIPSNDFILHSVAGKSAAEAEPFPAPVIGPVFTYRYDFKSPSFSLFSFSTRYPGTPPGRAPSLLMGEFLSRWFL
jgi:hypothetical protein